MGRVDLPSRDDPHEPYGPDKTRTSHEVVEESPRFRHAADERVREHRPEGHVPTSGSRGFGGKVLVCLHCLDEATELGSERRQRDGMGAVPIDPRGDLDDGVLG